MSELIALDTRGSAVHLILNRTDKANALTQEMWESFPGYVSHAATIPGARSIVLRSAVDTIFSAGADVAEYSQNVGTVDWALANHDRVMAATQSLADSPLVTIARIAGPCAGGAVGLIAACDLRLAADSAVFAVPPAKLGLVYPQPDTARLVDLMGVSATKRMLLTAARLDAHWALRVGLVDECLPIDDLDAAIDEIVNQVAGGAPISIRAMKKTVAAVADGLRTEDDFTQALLLEALRHPDHAEGTRAFLARQAPNFHG